MGKSGRRESAKKSNIMSGNRCLTNRTNGEIANAKGCERVSNEAANLMQKSGEYQENGNWQLRTVIQVT
jgi:hypothetical protein